MTEQIEGLTDEVLFLVEKSDDGMTLGDLYDASVLADSQQAVAGAVHRLTSKGVLIRSTDKRVRTRDQAARSAAQPPAPGRQSTTDKMRERKAAKKKAVRRKATAKPVARQGTGTVPGDSDAKSEALEHAIEVTAGEDAADDNPVCPGFYLADDYDLVRLCGLLEDVAQLQSDQRLQDELRDIAGKLFERQNRVDAADAEVNERTAELVRSMGIPVASFRPGAPVLPACVAELLERASADAQEHLDAYLSELDDPVLDYLIEVASSTKELAEAARAAAGGSE